VIGADAGLADEGLRREEEAAREAVEKARARTESIRARLEAERARLQEERESLLRRRFEKGERHRGRLEAVVESIRADKQRDEEQAHVQKRVTELERDISRFKADAKMRHHAAQEALERTSLRTVEDAVAKAEQDVEKRIVKEAERTEEKIKAATMRAEQTEMELLRKEIELRHAVDEARAHVRLEADVMLRAKADELQRDVAEAAAVAQRGAEANLRELSAAAHKALARAVRAEEEIETMDAIVPPAAGAVPDTDAADECRRAAESDAVGRAARREQADEPDDRQLAEALLQTRNDIAHLTEEKRTLMQELETLRGMVDAVRQDSEDALSVPTPRLSRRAARRPPRGRRVPMDAPAHAMHLPSGGSAETHAPALVA